MKDSLLLSFQQNLPRLVKNNSNFQSIDVEILPLVTSGSSCDGLFTYRTFVGNINPYYANGIPYYFYAVKANQVIFFEENRESNLQKLETLKELNTYSQIREYEEDILDNLIYIK